MNDSAANGRESVSVASVSFVQAWWPQLVVLVYFFSGTVALSYEVLWARLLSLQFGISIFGVVVTVAAFMAGLGFGSLFGTRRFWNKLNPFFVLGVIEIAVALFSILMPFFFSALDNLIIGASTDWGFYSWSALQLFVALLVLFVPAAALGLGFPLVLRVLRTSTVSVGTVYGVNALGGVLGAFLPLLLLPTLGLSASLYCIAILGVSIGVVFLVLSKNSRLTSKEESQAAPLHSIHSNSSAVFSWQALLAYALIGAASLILQIAWTRIYGMLLLRTEYIMAVILMVFLLGMALGSVVMRSRQGACWLTLFPVLAAFGAVASLWTLPIVAATAAQAQYTSLSSALFYQGGYVALCTLPVTFLLGAWLPMLANAFKNSGEIVAAKFYGANAVGSALGALAAGFVLFPLLGSAGTIAFAAVAILLAGLYFSPIKKKAVLLVLPLLALIVPVRDLPPAAELLPATLSGSRDVFVHEDAVSITHVVEQNDGQRLLLADLQRMDASSEPSAVVSQQNQARLPLLLHPHPQNVLFLGVGTGISASGSSGYENLERVGVELSQGAIIAAEQYFSVVNGDLLQKGELQIIRDDARRYLKTASKSFDVIVGDLFHPDLVGRGALLSLEQFARAKARLNQNGVFVQWLAMNQFDRRSLEVVLRTFASVFDRNQIYLDGFRLALVGLQGDSVGNASAVVENLSMLSSEQQSLVTGGEEGWTWLGRYFGTIKPSKGDIQGELATIVEFQLPKARYSGDVDLVKVLRMLLRNRPTVEAAAEDLEVTNDNQERFERAYMASELGLRSWMASVEGKYEEAERLARFAYSANPKDRWVSFDLADRMYATLDQAVAAGYDRQAALQRVLDIRPDHEKALRDMVKVAREKGEREKAQVYLAKLKELSPLSNDLPQ